MTTPPERQSVVVTDVQIPFGSMVALLLKAAFAAIPALVVVTVVVTFAAAFFMALVARA